MPGVTRSLSLLTLVLLALGLFMLALPQREAEIKRLEQLLEDRPQEVISRLEVIVNDAPSPRVYFLLARAWARIDANESLVWLEKVFEASTEHQEAWQLWADIMTETEQYEYAVLRLQQQLRRNPESAYLRLLLAQIYVTTDALSDAEKEFRQVIEVAPEASEHKTRALYSLGYLYVSSDRFREGEPLLREALSRDSAYVPEIRDLAELLMDRGEWQQASQLLARLSDLQPEDSLILLLLGRSYLKLSQWAEAARVLTESLKKQPDHIQTHFFLGKAYRGMRHRVRAMQHFQTFRRLQRKAAVEKLASDLRADPESLSVVQLLDKIVRTAKPETYNTLNDKRVALFSSRIAQEKDPVRKISLRALRVQELVNAGRNQEAIQEASRLRETLTSQRVPESDPLVASLRELLATAYLRQGEREDCVERHSADSCRIPIVGGGIHTIEQGSRQAIKEFTSLLESYPNHLGYRWLLNLAYMTLGEYPGNVPVRWRIPPTVFESNYDIGRFQDIAPTLGIDVIGRAGGSIMEDFDGDGYLDIMGSSSDLSDPLRYFHNNGDGTFTDWSKKAGLLGQLGGLNITQADYDNDSYPDVLVLRGGWMGSRQVGHPNSLLRNDGDGTFTDVTVKAGLLSFNPSQTAAWADYNLDGYLDLFIGNESSKEQTLPCELFHNKGDGTFTEVALEVGLDETGFVKGVAWGDYNNDGYPDLYISRFEKSNLLYRNDGPQEAGWKFKEVTAKAGVSEPKLSFPTWFFDYNNDGWEDIFVTSFSSYGEDPLDPIVADYLGRPKDGYSRLYRNNGDGTFTDITREARIDAVLMSMGANFGDLDNDGFLDCYFGTGQPNMMTLIPNRVFRNFEGKFFQDVTTSGGFGHLAKGHGISFGDVDNDGDQDIHVVLGGAYAGDAYQNLLLHNPGHSNHWITLRLQGAHSNRLAVGARIKVNLLTENGERAVYSTVGTGGSFGASSLQQEIGLGQARAIRSIEIRWPVHKRKPQIIKDVPMDRIVKIREGNPRASVVESKAIHFSASSSRTRQAQH